MKTVSFCILSFSIEKREEKTSSRWDSTGNTDVDEGKVGCKIEDLSAFTDDLASRESECKYRTDGERV